MKNFKILMTEVSAHKRMVRILSMVFALTALSLQVGAQQYSLRVIPTLGGTANRGAAINASGQVAGVSCLAGKVCYIALNDITTRDLHAFVYTNGTLQDLGTLGSADNYSAACAINTSGDVAGTSKPPGHAEHAFVYHNGAIQDLGTLGGTNSIAFGINDSGQVVGNSDMAGGVPTRGFLYTNGSMQDLGTLEGIGYTSATGINASGTVTGSSWITIDTTQHMHAYRYSNGAMEDLGSVSGPAGTSGAAAINASGVVTGFSYTATHDEVAFLYSSGPMQALPHRDASDMGLGVNAHGQVVGQFFPPTSNVNHALLITRGHAFDLNNLISSTDAATYTLTDAPGINDRGQIVANGFRTASPENPRPYRTFLLTPIRNQ